MIQHMQLTFTTDMEKGLQQRHGVSYAEYGSSLEKRLKIEQERTNEHDACKSLIQSMHLHV